MAFILSRINNEPNRTVYTFKCDEVEDLDDIPDRYLTMGTEALIINTGAVYCLNSEFEWKEI